MSAPAIFVSHSHQDDEYCHTFVASLRAAGLDVWYDEHNATSGHLRTLIERELRQRPIFIVVLSPAALKSQWVSDECDWAYSLYRKEQARRVILPVLAETVDEDAIWLFMQQFKRIEQPGLIPWPVAEAARRAALAVHPNATLATTPAASAQTPATPNTSNDAEAFIAAGNTLVSVGQRAAAVDMFRRATQMDPRSVAAWNQLGYYLEYDAHHEEGLQAFEEVLKLDPRNAFAWAGKAETLAWLERPQEALPAAEMALRLDPNLAYAHSAKGAVLHSIERYTEAVTSYDRATALDPNDAETWGNKGFALNNLKRYEEALDAYNHALALDPNFAVNWSNKGSTLRSLGRHQEALDAYNRALALGQNAIRWYGKANALRRLGRTREAEEAERKAKELEAQEKKQ